MKFSTLKLIEGKFTLQSQVDPPPIVSLIRDTEQHERALFTLPSSTMSSKNSLAPRRSTAVGTVLGGDMAEQLRGVTRAAQTKGEVDVEMLLEGAEKLVNV